MIESEEQYRITKDWADKFRQTIRDYVAPEGVDPRLVAATKAGLLGQLADFEESLAEYESRHHDG